MAGQTDKVRKGAILSWKVSEKIEEKKLQKLKGTQEANKYVCIS